MSDRSHNHSQAAALAQLKEGNARFVAENCSHHGQGPDLRKKLALEGQHPFAAVLACSDSRVPVELLFDQGFGDLFVIRVAGAVPGPDQLGSLEYAVEHLGVPLVLVLGHTGCGAVAAAVDKHQAPGALGVLLDRLKPVVSSVEHLPQPQRAKIAVGEAVKYVVKQITALSPVLDKAQKQGQLLCLGAVYNIETGLVEFYET